MQVKCQPASTESEIAQCLAVRKAVFIDEQNVPLEREQDGKDRDARHFSVVIGDDVIATCRVRFMGSAVKIERMAVVKPQRGKGIGAILVRYVIQQLSGVNDIHLFKLSSQADAVPFYEKLGFRTHGGEYMDAGIPHYDMVLEK